ncbi:hypothetical protein INH39_02665 [Massilia violaceinigra]|uniref:Uncharacterized protein n=1 Tax=Massilia violaceinigra TaxID=2045208 RepID=A0ABY4A7E5_9BURK|nr:hypothetical protein [Massilia violaceinigra]UOD30670.1 hypothetical protein INH39_02665 [Massilia violaceinigra]
MNTLRLELENVVGRQLIRGGIVFEDIAIVRVFVDEEDLLEAVDFDGALVCFDELKQSMSGSGNYLIFTCACGIAEDGGWEGVAVEMTETTVSWHLEAGSRALNYCFDLTGYVASLEALGRTLATNALPLEPGQVVFPDSFIPRKDLCRVPCS